MAFEGCDRSGKSTQSKMLVDYLKSIGRDVEHLRFPGKHDFTIFVTLGSMSSILLFIGRYIIALELQGFLTRFLTIKNFFYKKLEIIRVAIPAEI